MASVPDSSRPGCATSQSSSWRWARAPLATRSRPRSPITMPAPGHAQGIRDAPRALLDAIPGLERREIAEGQLCCGSAGVYNLLQPGPAGELGDRKAANVRATGAGALVTANPGCTMQIRAAAERGGWSIAAYHIAEVLDASVRGPSSGQSGPSCLYDAYVSTADAKGPASPSPSPSPARTPAMWSRRDHGPLRGYCWR